MIYLIALYLMIMIDMKHFSVQMGMLRNENIYMDYLNCVYNLIQFTFFASGNTFSFIL